MDDRERRQMIAFYGTGLATILSALIVRRSVAARRYVPSMFDANQHPPKFNMVRDAFHAVSNASFLSLSTFSFGIASVAWIYDIGNLREFGLIMKNALGGIDREKQLAAIPVEKDVAEIESSLEEALGGKK